MIIQFKILYLFKILLIFIYYFILFELNHNLFKRYMLIKIIQNGVEVIEGVFPKLHKTWQNKNE